MNEDSQLPVTLAQSLISQGLITSPEFIQAAQLQAKLLKNGSYRLLGSILADLHQQGHTDALPVHK